MPNQYLQSQPAAGQKVGEMLERKDIDAVLRFQNRSARVDDDPTDQPFKVCYGTQALAPGIGERGTGLRFNCDEIRTPREQEINFGFGPAGGRPVIDGVTDAAVILVSPDQLRNHSFEQSPPFLGCEAAESGNKYGVP